MIRFILAMGAGAAVTVMEQRMTQNVTSLHRVFVAAVVIVPVAALCWWLSYRAARSATAPSRPATQRSAVAFGSVPGRRG